MIPGQVGGEVKGPIGVSGKVRRKCLYGGGFPLFVGTYGPLKCSSMFLFFFLFPDENPRVNDPVSCTYIMGTVSHRVFDLD